MEDKRVFTEKDRKDAEGAFMDNPEYLKTDKESIYDMHEDMKFVDAIPLEDVKLEWEMEVQENHRETKDNSSSEQRYPGTK